MAVVSIPNYEPWIVARWVFHELLEPALELVDLEEDRYAIQQAMALDGLHFELIEDDAQVVRLARAVQSSGDELRSRLRDAGTELDDDFAERLGTLSLRLSDFTGR